jgi:hypothetical protein
MSQRCSAKNRNGKRCGAWPVRGTAKCALAFGPRKSGRNGLETWSQADRHLPSRSALQASQLAVPSRRLAVRNRVNTEVKRCSVDK